MRTPTLGRHARNAQQSAHPELWDGLVGVWVPELGNQGGTLFDVSGNNRNGSIVGGASSTMWRVEDGVKSVYIPSSGSLDLSGHDFFTGRMTLVIDFKPGFKYIVGSPYTRVALGTSAGGSHIMLQYDTASAVAHHNWRLRFRSGYSSEIELAGTSFNSNAEFQQWQQVAATIDSDGSNVTLKLYLNGLLQNSMNMSVNAWVNNPNWHWNPDNTFESFVRSITIYKTVLSASKIAKLSLDHLAPLRLRPTYFGMATTGGGSMLLTAATTAALDLTADLATEITSSALLSGSSQVKGQLTTGINLVTSLVNSLNLQSNIATVINLTSSLTGELNLTPSLTTDTRFNSLISGDQFIQSSLSTELNLTTNLSNVLNLTSSLTTELNLTTTASNSANITADLSVGQNIFLTASPVFESDISSDLSTGISLTASVVSNLEVTPVLETQTLVTALTSGTAVAGAQLQTVINLVSQIVNNADTSSSLTVGSNVSSTIALSGSVSANLLTQVTLSAITDGGSLVTATIQTSVEMATALLGESDILAGSLIADTDFMTGVTASATITSGLFTGIALTSATFGEGFMSGDIVLVIPSVGTFTMSNVTITFSGMSGVTVTQSEMSKVSLTF